MPSTYQSRLSHSHSRSRSFSFSSSTPKPRTVLKPPERPLALRREYVTETKTRLVVRPQGDSGSAVSYEISDEDETLLFTVTGWKFSDRCCREFRDASGLPLFELHRNWLSFARSRSGRGVWAATLPGGGASRGFPTGIGRKRRSSSRSGNRSGGDDGNGNGSGNGSDNASYLATGTPRIRSFSASPFGNFSVTLECNAAALPMKRDEEKKLTLEIERHGNALALFDVVDGDRKVAEVRESILHNKILPLISSQSGYRPVLDVIVTSGVDLSLVSVHPRCKPAFFFFFFG